MSYNPRRLYKKISSSYGLHRPQYPSKLYSWISANVDAPETKVVLDIGCGSGQATARVAELFYRVYGVDSCIEQLIHAEFQRNVLFICADAERLPICDQSIDIITAGCSLHWLNLDAFYTEVQRILKPGGFIFAWTITSMGTVHGNDKSVQEINLLIHFFFYHVLGPYWPSAYQHSVTGYRFLSFPYEEVHVEDPLYQTSRMRINDYIAYLETWSSIEDMKQRGGTLKFKEFTEALSLLWGDQELTVTFNLAMRAGRLTANSK